MVLATAEAVRVLSELTGLTPDVIAKILWGMLLAGMVCATIHLLTMLVTRWGDSDPSQKSLIFSILVHISCAVGLVAISPPVTVPQTAAAEVPVNVKRTLVNADESKSRSEPGNTPAWQQLPEPAPEPVDRLPLASAELKPPAAPERQAERLEPAGPQVPDLVQRPELAPARPELVEVADTGPRKPADLPLNLPDPVAEVRPEIRSPANSRLSRSPGPSESSSRETVDRSVTRPMSQRSKTPARPVVDSQGLQAPPVSVSNIKRAPVGEAIRRREIPVTETTGEDRKGTTPDAVAGTPGRAEFTRLRNRRPVGDPDGVVTRELPRTSPRTPSPAATETRSVRDGLASRVSVPRIPSNLPRPDKASTLRRRELSLPAAYRLRDLSRRREAARQFGGTEASERAVEASLAWLVRHQHADGHWDADGFSVHCPAGKRCRDPGGRGLHGDVGRSARERRAGLHADSGITALSLLAFLGAGYTHEEGRHASRVARAIEWLIAQQQTNGFLGGRATRYARHYCHAMASYALAEALGMQNDKTQNPRLRKAVERGVAYILSQQNLNDGGWRYIKDQRSDMSMFGWQLMALKSAEIAGLNVPASSKKLMIKFLNDRSQGRFKGLASYRVVEPPLPVSPAMTAEALFSKQMLGIRRDHPSSGEAVGFLSERLPRLSQTNLYYWYYGTLAMYQFGGEPWERWNGALRNLLVSTQQTGGHAAGSWDPRGPWGPHGGRVYATAVSALCLEVYYRFLPLYQLNNESAEQVPASRQ